MGSCRSPGSLAARDLQESPAGLVFADSQTMRLEMREFVPPSALSGFPNLVFFAGTVLFVAVLYWAQAILIPIALAILLTFLLAPPVSGLQRVGLKRGLSVALVVLFTLLLLGGAAWLATTQLSTLADELPHYRANIREKIIDLRNFQRGGALEKLGNMIGEVKSEFSKGSKRSAPPAAPPSLSAPAERPLLLKNISQPLASAGLVLLLVIYMLAQREELRNRVRSEERRVGKA